MDPAAPNNPNNPNSNPPPSGQPPINPIQPGQFVVAGGEPDGVFKEPLTPAGVPTPQPMPSPMQPPAPTQFQGTPAPEPSLPPQPAMHLAQTSFEPTTPFSENQPNPTPFVPPGATPPALESSGNSGIKKLRTLAIIIVILILVGVIAALVWFLFGEKLRLFLGKSKDQAATGTTQDVQVELSSPLPKRTSGGFSEFPSPTPATAGAQQATPSASPK